MTLMVLRSIAQLSKRGKAGVILFVSLLMPILERLAELLGLFTHSEDWNHLYSFFGYGLFLTVVMFFHEWMRKQLD